MNLDAYPSHEKEYYHNHPGQNRTSNSDLSSSSQSSKDIQSTSKLSATAATFSQGAPLTGTSPTGAFLINPVSFPLPTYLPSHQDRTLTYPSIDSRVKTLRILFFLLVMIRVFSRIIVMVLHMVVKPIEIITINSVHIRIQRGIRNSNASHFC